MVVPFHGVKKTAFQKSAFQNNAFEIGANVGWFPEWDKPQPWRSPDHWYPEDVDEIMRVQRAGKFRDRPMPDWALQAWLRQYQEDLTNEWYDGHVRAMRKRKKKNPWLRTQI